ncbi:MAG: hypothetical protein R2706_16745 [Acidimicrobiales bacterium]
MSGRLLDVQSALELTLPSLLSEQRKAYRSTGTGTDINATVFWQEVAEPRATHYAEQAIAVIDEELTTAHDAVRQFRRSVRAFSHETGRRHDQRATNRWIAEALQPIVHCGPSMDRINTLGEAWQKKLRRAAVRRSIPDLLLNPHIAARDIIAKTEMELLEASPWILGDRLLSAFELATTDIRNHLLDAVTKLANPPTASQTDRYQV